MKLYFAYGSNMSPDTMTAVCPNSRFVGEARLSNYRLRFSRRSIRTHTGVADVVPTEGFGVIGMLYEVPENEWEALERKEGLRLASPAYREISATVFSYRTGMQVPVSAFVVRVPEVHEQIPSPEYLQSMIEAVERHNEFMPYLEFLKWLKRCVETSNPDIFRRGTLVLPTSVRNRAHGRYLIRANPSAVDLPRNARRVLVEFDGKTTVANFDPSADIPDNVCEMDQNLRHALGMSGRDGYGQTVTLRAIKRRRIPRYLVESRNLCLRVQPTNWNDSEKRICILHPKNIVLLGLEEGEHVEVECSTLRNHKVITKVARYRVHSSERRPEQSRNYPEIDCVYLDRECRDELALPRELDPFPNWPVLVRPSISHLLRRRVAVYGITFLLGIASLGQVLGLLLPQFNGIPRGVAAVILSIIATALVAWIDVRAKVRY
ncbi:gamma-glutamylcyclotransferase family protein [Nocardia sp. NPDC051052]|uniref:gamma-glutamylcyclotransferase family protein n=1 Tax=Nocardia sp. NPDC051052 TaxID=3364322 RepID=UPI00379FD206